LLKNQFSRIKITIWFYIETFLSNTTNKAPACGYFAARSNKMQINQRFTGRINYLNTSF